MKPSHYLLILSSTIACTQPEMAILAPEPTNNANTTDTLTFTGYYQPEACRLFINARITATGELVPDDTVEPQSCNEPASPFSVETFRFPNFHGPDHNGLRFTLNQHLLLGNYQFIPEGFELDSFFVSERKIYTFASPGHQHLQVFFSDTMLTTPVRQYFTFQLVRGRGEAPQFTLLEGTYDPNTDLVNFQNLPDLHAPDNLSLSIYADSLGSSVHADSLGSSVHADSSGSSVRIYSIYHLLTEDFALWNDNEDCEDLQNWDLQLIPATGYNVLEAKVDPPFLECLTQEETFNFRIALLR